LDKDELNLLNDVFHRVGDLPDAGDINLEKILEAFSFDKKVIGETLQFILLEGIGKPKIWNSKDIPQSHIKQTLEKVLQKQTF
jgi:3-dehydroquinate synthetase